MSCIQPLGLNTSVYFVLQPATTAVLLLTRHHASKTLEDALN